MNTDQNPTPTENGEEPKKMVNIPAIAKGGGDDALGAYLGEIGKYELLTAEREVELAQEIEAGREADRLLGEGVATAKERIRLKRRSDRGQEASSLFLVSNLRLVAANAKKNSSAKGIDLINLIQEGNLGLIRAVEKFEWRKGFKFSAYATWWIRQAITRAIADKSRTVRVPVHLHDTLGAVRAANRLPEVVLGAGAQRGGDRRGDGGDGGAGGVGAQYHGHRLPPNITQKPGGRHRRNRAKNGNRPRMKTPPTLKTPPTNEA